MSRQARSSELSAELAAERSATCSIAFFDALLIEKLADLTVVEWPVGFRLSYPIEELIEMMVLAGGDADRLLRAWATAQNPGAGVHLAALASQLHMSDGEMILHSSCLKEYGDACRAVGRFVCRRETIERLEQTFFMLGDRPQLQQIVSDGQGLLESMLPRTT